MIAFAGLTRNTRHKLFMNDVLPHYSMHKPKWSVW